MQTLISLWKNLKMALLLSNLKTPKFDKRPIEGHHKYNAIDHPHIADDGKNIYPATWDEHFERWHNKNFQNETYGKPLNLDFNEQF